MKRFSPARNILLILLATCTLALITPACNSNKKGCPINEQASGSNTNKRGELSTKRGKSNLFPKKMR